MKPPFNTCLSRLPLMRVVAAIAIAVPLVASADPSTVSRSKQLVTKHHVLTLKAGGAAPAKLKMDIPQPLKHAKIVAAAGGGEWASVGTFNTNTPFVKGLGFLHFMDPGASVGHDVEPTGYTTFKAGTGAFGSSYMDLVLKAPVKTRFLIDCTVIPLGKDITYSLKPWTGKASTVAMLDKNHVVFGIEMEDTSVSVALYADRAWMLMGCSTLRKNA